MNSKSLLLAPDTRVTCPACDQEYSLEQGFARQALEAVESASASALAQLKDQERAAVEKRAQQLAGEQAKAAQRRVEDLQAILKTQADAHSQALAQMRAVTERSSMQQLEALKEQLATSQNKLAALDQREAAITLREQGIETRVQEAAATRVVELVAAERRDYEQRLAESHAQLKQLRDEQLALREERQRLRDEKDALALEVQKQVDARLSERESTVRTQEQEKSKLDKAELQKKLDDAVAQLAAAQRKMEQGSQQLQGEVLELAIEDGLRRSFALDVIEEVKKGARGGDVIHRVMSRSGQAAGVMLWESKRARDWSPAWIAKLKEDMRGSGAEIGILVSMGSAVPKDWSEGQLFGLHDEVWVTTWSAAMQLAAVLRAGLLDVHKQRLISAGKGEKMEAVYDYLTSPQFAHKLKAVYGAFQKMREELESERSVTQQRWARREKQLQSGVAELLGVAGDLQGLAQQELPALELEAPGAQS
ncbi:MAG TPA: DUF2130 domain-containing protein [Steroidobacteraceae bacterium]|jgi:hypothetical protein|nr:DUF2130 domain-containing protein [Steroidobacteraceae bacterium]